MKNVFILFFAFFSIIGYSQNVGINTLTPKLALDIKGGLRNQPLYLTGSGTSIVIPANESNVNLTGTFSGPFSTTVSNPEDGQKLIIDNNSGQTGILSGSVDIRPGLNEYTYSDGEWKAINTNAWGLNGNSNTDPNNNYIGTADKKDVVFKRYNDEKMRITENEIQLKDNTMIELGSGILNKQEDNGKIAYGAFGSPDELSIVGAGVDPSGLDRRIKLWADGGTLFTGGATLNGSLTTTGEIKPNGSSGSTGQVLTSNGDGTMSWTTMMSSGSSDNVGNYGTVTNPITGKTWLDRNLGATQVATSPTDTLSYGDLYQWGRNAEGHQKRTSGTTVTQAGNFFTTDGLFITTNTSPFNWLNVVETHMWSGTAAENNPCPSGFRIPNAAEWEQERLTWISNNAAGAFASPLKLPMAGYRSFSDGSLVFISTFGYYWGRTVTGTLAYYLGFVSSASNMLAGDRAMGGSIRCIQD